MNALTRLPGVMRAIYRNNRRQVDLPRFLTYIVTYTCNARCIMCDSWKIESPNDLSLDEISGVFDQLPRMDAVRLTGGEPFVRKDLLEIAHLAQEKLRPIFLHVTTNGFLTDRIIKFCEEREKSLPLSLLVSIDGVEEKHNYVRGKDSAWKTAMGTLTALATRKKELNLSLAINQTIVDAEGVEHYRKLREIIQPMGIHHNMVMAYDKSATYSTERDIEVAPQGIGNFSTFGEFTEDHLNELMGEVEKDIELLPLAERLSKRYYLKGIRNRLLNAEGTPNPKCVALNTHMRLYPNGDVPVCQFNSKTVGNFRRQSFEEIWYGEEITKHRDWVHKCPGCWAECEVLPSAIYTGDLLLESLRNGRNGKH